MPDFFDSPQSRSLLGFVIASLVATLAYRLRALSTSGAVAATMVGGVIVAAAGWWAGVVLVTFFATSSALSTFSSIRSPVGEQVRGKRRDAVQVLANGGIPALLAAMSALPAESGPWLVAMTSAIAGAASDTWATELGRLNRTWPRLITSWNVVPPGTSGAISGYGTLGSLAGSLLIAIVAASGAGLGWSLIWTVTLAGLAGSILDSVLGATVQAGYHCPGCDQSTVTPLHHCGGSANIVRGHRWMNNDTVNFLAILGSACVGLAFSFAWQPVG